MWESLVLHPLGSVSARKYIAVLASLLVACFAYISVFSTPVHAADPATWNDTSIVYNGKTYTGPSTVDNPANFGGLEKGTTYYSSIESGPPGVSRKAYIIYFTSGVSPPEATTATYAEYDYQGGAFNNKSNQASITITPKPAGVSAGGTTSCNVDGALIGWMICPISNFLANSMDYLYGVISEFLEVRPLATTQDNALYRAWDVARNLANLCFIIGFLIIIYAQISGGLVSNYTLKKLLPRIIIAAVLVNISYWISAIGIDVSNILGYAVQDLFTQIRSTLVGNESVTLSWANLTEAIVTGGTATLAIGVTGAAAIAATGGSIASAIFLLLPALVGVIMAALIAIIVLAMRQAIITLLVIVAPLAFVAYLLPNTEKWFEKWRGLFMTMLLLFPIFSVVFGASQLAGAAIIQTGASESITLVILGMVVQVAPLVITPLIVRFSGTLLGRLAGMLNNPNKGLIDRTRNWASPRAELYKNRNLARQNSGIHALGAGRVARRFYRNDKTREKRNEAYKTEADNRVHEFQPYENPGGSRFATVNNYRDNRNRAYARTGYGSWVDQAKDADLRHKELESAHDEHYYGATSNAAAGSVGARRKAMMENAQVSESKSKLFQDNVSADSKLTFKQEVEASRALSRVVKDTYHTEQAAQIYDTIVQDAAKKSWNDRVRNDASTREIFLKSTRNSDSAKVAEQRVVGMVEEIKAVGGDAKQLTTNNGAAFNDVNGKQFAEQVKNLQRDSEIESQIQGSAKIKQQSNFANELKVNAKLRQRAAGVDAHGEVRVLAAAKKAVSEEMIKATNNFFDTMDYDIASSPQQLEKAWHDAESRGELSEMIAYARKMSVNAPGLRKLKPLLEEYTASRGPLDDDVMLLKEVLGSDQTFRNAGRDLEVWANNESDFDGNLYANFAEVRNAPAPWANITASRFARMNAYSQEEALYWLQNRNDDGKALRGLLSGIGEEGSPIWGELKGSVRDAISTIRSGDEIRDPNGPFAPRDDDEDPDGVS